MLRFLKNQKTNSHHNRCIQSQIEPAFYMPSIRIAHFFVASGKIAAEIFPFLHSPLLISSTDSVLIQCPSNVIPIRSRSYFSLLMRSITLAADMQDTSCSDDCPPKMTAAVFLSIFISPHLSLFQKSLKSFFS